MKSVNIIAPVNNLGYGVASINICKALAKRGIRVSLFPIGQPSFSCEQEALDISPMIQSQGSFDPKAPCLKIWHEHSMGERVGTGKFVGFPFFEINKFDAARKNHLSSCDEIAVSCEWAKKIVQQEVLNSTVHSIPLGVDGSTFTALPPAKSDRFVFFNCGKWEKRKGHDILIDLFMRAFRTEPDVELWMMCENPFLPPDHQSHWINLYKQDPRVRLINRVQSQSELAQLANSTDCGIFPSRAEGWNLEILELMSLGKSIITTDYSAHTEFCNDKNSMLVKPEKTEPAFDGFFFAGLGEWASLEGTEEKFVDHMRSIYETWKRGGKERIINHEGLDTAKEFSWDNTAKKLEEVLYEN